MRLDPDTALIYWLPGNVESAAVTVRVTDSHGASSVFTFAVNVQDIPAFVMGGRGSTAERGIVVPLMGFTPGGVSVGVDVYCMKKADIADAWIVWDGG